MRRLPPLNSLRAFEATARHLSFTRAADELCVSQGAVSRHVRNLEQHLGITLLQRTTRQLVLTNAGETLLQGAGDAFDALAATTEKLGLAGTVLKLQIAPSFAIAWLMPRLPCFEAGEQCAPVRLTMQTYNVAVSPETDYFDACILYGDGHWQGLHSDLLLEEQLTPVCAPALMQAVRSGFASRQYQQIALLHNSITHQDWKRWASHCNLSGLDTDSGSAFETMDQAVNAAIAGHGVTMGDLSLLTDKLESGQLVRPFDDILTSSKGYYFICQHEKLAMPSIAAFRQWLIAQLAN